MNARATLLLVLVISLALVPVLAAAPPASAQSGYTERLDVYTAGQGALWSITANQVAGNSSWLKSIDSTTGVTGYKLVAMSTQSATSDLQVFGINGYNILKLPSEPTDGLFLTVNASSASDASSLVSSVASKFATEFTQVSSSSGSWTYFAPVDFVNVAIPVLYPLVPTSEGGFLSFAPQTTLEALPAPFIVLTGTTTSSSSSGLTNTIAIGAAATSVLSSTGTLNLSELIGSTNATITASNSSSSSTVVVHSLDGVIVSTDSSATIANHLSNYSGSYALAVSPDKVVNVNATIESQPPTALAYRELDRGALTANQTLGVTIVVSNNAKTGTLDNVTVNDDWWKSYPQLFSLSTGNYSFTIPSIAAGQNETETYVLNVLSSSSAQVVIPSATATYSYKLSTGVFSGRATLGQQVVQLNQVGPALSLTARPSVPSGTPLGTAGDYVVTITNNGNSPALNVRLDNYTVSNIAENGGTSTIDIPLSLTGLAQQNYTRTFPVEYANTAGVSQNITTNSVQLVLSHTSMVIPFIQVATNDTVSASTIAAKSVNVTYTFTNGGTGSPTSVAATETFPQGVICQVTSGISSCSGSTYSMTTSSLTTQKNNLKLTFGSDNYIIPPTVVTATYEGMHLLSYGGTYVIAAGIAVSKSFSPDTGFPGSSSVVTVNMTNVGSLPVYNATVGSNFDSFDKASSSNETTSKTYSQIGPNTTSTFSYPLTFSGTSYGNLTSQPVTTDFLFAGAAQGLSLGQSSVVVYAPPTATVSTSPSSPEENHDFTLTVTLTNSAAVAVSNVVYTFPLPTGVSVISGAPVSDHNVTITIASMAPNSNQNVSLRLSSNTGLTIDTSSAHLSFQYLGSTLSGVSNAAKIVVRVDVTTRYEIPIAVAIVIGLIAVVYVRRKVEASAKP